MILISIESMEQYSGRRGEGEEGEGRERERERERV